MSFTTWISGMVTDIEAYLAKAEAIIKADLTPVLANIETEFVTAEKKFAEDVYAAFKSIVSNIWAQSLAAHPGDLIAAVEATFKAALPALKSGGITLAESALLQFIASLA
jgi:hypothetical protein